MELIIQENLGGKKMGLQMLTRILLEQCIIQRHSLLTKKNKLSQIKTKYFERLKPQSRKNKFSLKEVSCAIGQQSLQIQETSCLLPPRSAY